MRKRREPSLRLVGGAVSQHAPAHLGAASADCRRASRSSSCSPAEGARRLAEGECDWRSCRSRRWRGRAICVAVPDVCIGARRKVGSVLLVADVPLARADDGRARSVVAHVGGAGAPAAARAARDRGEPRSRRVRRRSWSACVDGTRGAVIIGDPALQALAARSSVHVRSGRAVARAHRHAVRLRRLGRPRRRRRRRGAARLSRARSATASSGSTRSPPTPDATASRPSARAATCATSYPFRLDDNMVAGRRRVPGARRRRAASCRRRALRLFDGTTPTALDVARRRRARRRRRAPQRRRDHRAARERAIFELGAAADRRRRALNPDGVVTLHRRPQHQLHERLHHRLPLLRVLPQPGDTPKATCCRARSSARRSREMVDAGGVQILLAGRAQSRAAARVVRRSLPLDQGDVSDQAARALARGDPASLPARSRCRSRRCCSGCVAAGLDSVPGGGAEILVDRVRRSIAKAKCTSAEWLEVMRVAHRMGLRSSRR